MECDRSLSPSQSFLSPPWSQSLARPAHGQSSPATAPTSSRARISPSPRHPAHRDPDYARTVNSYPHKHEKEAILASLHAIPGNEKYTLHSLAAWFSRHRNPSPVLLNDETIRESPPPAHVPRSPVGSLSKAHPSAPPATPRALQKKPEPLGGHRHVLGRTHQRRKSRDSSLDPVSAGERERNPRVPRHTVAGPRQREPHRVRVPTYPLANPGRVAVSTDTHAVIAPDRRQGRGLSMFIARVVIRRSVVQAPLRDGSATVVVETPNNGTSIHYFPSSVFTARQAAAAVPRALLRVGGQRDLNTTLAASIRDSLQPVPSEQPPSTPVEFSEKFERTEHLIEAFMKKYDSGELVRLGWDSGTSLLCRVHRCSCSQVSAGHDLFSRLVDHTYCTVFLYGC